jgi:hypothetical protein
MKEFAYLSVEVDSLGGCSERCPFIDKRIDLEYVYYCRLFSCQLRSFPNSCPGIERLMVCREATEDPGPEFFTGAPVEGYIRELGHMVKECPGCGCLIVNSRDMCIRCSKDLDEEEGDIMQLDERNREEGLNLPLHKLSEAGLVETVPPAHPPIETIRDDRIHLDSVLVQVSDFTRTPGGRFMTDGPFSGEEFRELYLEKHFNGEDLDYKVEVDLRGTEGYTSSFLDEAFGGLVRKFPDRKVRKRLLFHCDGITHVAREIAEILWEASKDG